MKITTRKKPAADYSMHDMSVASYTVNGENLEINAEFLLEQSEKGVHAASDHWEDALMSRILTIGC